LNSPDGVWRILKGHSQLIENNTVEILQTASAERACKEIQPIEEK
jgi:hypothetical protein